MSTPNDASSLTIEELMDAQQELCAYVACRLYGQSCKPGYFHPWLPGIKTAYCLLPLFYSLPRFFRGVYTYPYDDFIEKAEGAVND